MAPAEHDETLRACGLTRGRALGVQVNGYKIAAALLGQLRMPRLYVWVRACANGVLPLPADCPSTRRRAGGGQHQLQRPAVPLHSSTVAHGAFAASQVWLAGSPTKLGICRATTTTWWHVATRRLRLQRRWLPRSIGASSMQRHVKDSCPSGGSQAGSMHLPYGWQLPACHGQPICS